MKTFQMITFFLAFYLSGFYGGHYMAYNSWYDKWEKYCAPYDGIESACTKVYVENWIGG